MDQTPQQCKIEFALWTAQRLCQAFYEEFGVWISVWTVRRILRMLGLTPQRPKRRATKHNPGDVKKWKDEEFPRIAKCARELLTGAKVVSAESAHDLI